VLKFSKEHHKGETYNYHIWPSNHNQIQIIHPVNQNWKQNTKPCQERSLQKQPPFFATLGESEEEQLFSQVTKSGKTGLCQVKRKKKLYTCTSEVGKTITFSLLS